MKQVNGLLGILAMTVCLLLLAVYILEIGPWRSMATVLLMGFFTTAIFGWQGWRFCVQAGNDLCRTGVWRPYLIQSLVLIILHAALVQTQALELLPNLKLINLGPVLQSLEGDWHRALPHPQPALSAWIWLSVYIFGFPALLLGTIIALHGRQEHDLLLRFIRACQIVAWLALPVFAFVAVPEVWIQLLDYLPPAVTVGEQLKFYRFLSGPFNCLPSLHCTLALLALVVSWSSGVPVLIWLGPTLAVLVCLSTLVCGVHWGLDVIISFPLAWVAWAAAGVCRSIPIRKALQ